MNKNTPNGFKLIELMVVLIVMAILAAMAIPSFNKSMESTREKEAQTTLELIYNAEAMYMLDKKMYCNGIDNSAFASYMENPNPKADYYTFSLVGDNTPTVPKDFTATATPKPGYSKYKTFSIDNKNQKVQ